VFTVAEGRPMKAQTSLSAAVGDPYSPAKQSCTFSKSPEYQPIVPVTDIITTFRHSYTLDYYLITALAAYTDPEDHGFMGNRNGCRSRPEASLPHDVQVRAVHRKVVQPNPLVGPNTRTAKTAPVGHYVISGPRFRVRNPFRFGLQVPPVSQKTDCV
jgi:hypothetical protein